MPVTVLVLSLGLEVSSPAGGWSIRSANAVPIFESCTATICALTRSATVPEV